jgi:hypothetical protein
MENKTDNQACLKHAVSTYSEFIGIFFCVHLYMRTQIMRTLQRVLVSLKSTCD